MMQFPDLSGGALAQLLPFLIMAGGGLLIVLIDAVAGRGKHLPWAWLSAPLPLAALIVYLIRWPGIGGPSDSFGGMYYEDAFGSFIGILVSLSTLFAIFLSDTFLQRMGRHRGEFFALLLFSASGMLLFSSSAEFLTLFLGLELLSIPVYILCGFLRTDPRSVEASMKYFLLGAFASAVFLFGGALIYVATGTMDLALAFSGHDGGIILTFGALLLLSGFLFKVAAVPFHMWTPDVYEGAPTAVTAFMAAGVKVAAFGALGRILFLMQPEMGMPAMTRLFWWVAVATMTLGNLSALTQGNIKRMLAFSSIAHAGYMLIGVTVFLASGDPEALTGVLYYLLAYALMNLGAFAVVILWGGRNEERLEIGEWAGFGWKSPAAALGLSIFMISLSGIPPTAGFFGKYTIFRNAVDHGFTSLVVIAVLNSALSVYYYFRVLVALYMRPSVREVSLDRSSLVGAVVVLCALGTLWFGAAPDTVIPGVPRILELVRESVLALR